MQAGDYYSILINYLVIGYAVFFHVLGTDAKSQGEMAQLISLGSFYLIMLINSLTSVLDATKQLGEIAGYSARICNLFRAMDAAASLAGPDSAKNVARCSPFSVDDPIWSTAGMSNSAILAFSPRGTSSRIDTHSKGSTPKTPSSGWLLVGGKATELNNVRTQGEGVTSAFGTVLPEVYRAQATTLLAPTAAVFAEGCSIQVSVHRLGSLELREVVGNVFPDLPLDAAVLCVCTYQRLQESGRIMRPNGVCFASLGLALK
jgi:hypothetical protein